jgi:hypothetical protein
MIISDFPNHVRHDFSCPVSSFHNSQVSNLGFANYSFKLEHSIIMTKQKMNRTNEGIGFLRKYKKNRKKKEWELDKQNL